MLTKRVAIPSTDERDCFIPMAIEYLAWEMGLCLALRVD